MTFERRRFLTTAAAVLAGALAPRAARAADYPTRPVRVLVGWLPGSAADTVVRIITQWLAQELGQAFIVENKAGAASNLAAQGLIAAPPDGYTIGLVGSTNAVNATLLAPLPFNLERDSVPVSGLVRFPMVVVAHPAVPARTIPELIALAKQKPGKIDMASFGAGTISHLAGELFKSMAGVDLTHVPYRGSGPAHIDLMSGRVQVMFDTLTASMPHIRSGAIRAIAVTGETRYPPLPDVPTVADTVPGYAASAWNGFAVPRGTPADIVEKLHRVINAGLKDPTVVSRLDAVAAMPYVTTPTGMGAYLASETERWAKVIRTAGIKAE